MVGLDGRSRNRPQWSVACGRCRRRCWPARRCGGTRSRSALGEQRGRRSGRRSRTGRPRPGRRGAGRDPFGAPRPAVPGRGRPGPPPSRVGPAPRRRPGRCRSWLRSPRRSRPGSEIFHRLVLPGHGARLPWRHIARSVRQQTPSTTRSHAMRTSRPRRSCLAVPGSSLKMLEKAQGLPADQVFLDLEDAVAPAGQAGRPQEHRGRAQRGRLGRQDPGRYGSTTSPPQWTYRDVLEVVEGAGANLDCVMLPKVQTRRAGRVARPDADPAREVARPAGGPHRHRGADRERPRTGQCGRHRRRVAPGGDDHLRSGRLHGVDQHEVAGGRRAASPTTRATRTTTSSCAS